MDPLTAAKLWMLVKPIKRIRLGLAKRRARKNGTELYDEIPIDIEENNVFPRGTMTKSGAVIASLGPVLTLLLVAFGGPVECSPEEVAAGCVAASAAATQLAASLGGLVTVGGSIIAWKGRNRANKPV